MFNPPEEPVVFVATEVEPTAQDGDPTDHPTAEELIAADLADQANTGLWR